MPGAAGTTAKGCCMLIGLQHPKPAEPLTNSLKYSINHVDSVTDPSVSAAWILCLGEQESPQRLREQERSAWLQDPRHGIHLQHSRPSINPRKQSPRPVPQGQALCAPRGPAATVFHYELRDQRGDSWKCVP